MPIFLLASMLPLYPPLPTQRASFALCVPCVAGAWRAAAMPRLVLLATALGWLLGEALAFLQPHQARLQIANKHEWTGSGRRSGEYTPRGCQHPS